MTTYIALLRGINVGGSGPLSMKALVPVLEREGLVNVRTYIQSGNVVFQSSARSTPAVAKSVGSAIERAFGFRPGVIVLSAGELDGIIDGNPFPTATAEPRALHVTFLQSVPAKADVKALERVKQPNERFVLKENAFYLHAPDGIGRSKLAARIERALGVSGTARNWRTVMQLKTMADGLRVVLLAVGLTLATAARGAGQDAGVDRLGWLQGCWATTRGDLVVEEHWMGPRGGTLLGMGRTTRGGALVDYELVVIRDKGEHLAYEAHPSGQPSAVFPVLAFDEASVVFENREHDFPQRVGYRRTGDALLAWIEGTTGGIERRMEFPYRRVRCDGD